MAVSEFRLDNLISALVGGIAGGLLVWGLLPTNTSTPSPDATVVPDATAAAGTLPAPQPAEPTTERLQRLETSMRGVQARVAEQSKVDVYEDGGDGEQKRVTLSAADPKFQTAVRSVIDKAKWEEEQFEQDKRNERSDKRISRQVDELTAELDLDESQADQVEVVLQTRSETFRALRDGDDRPVSRADWREKFTQIQADTRKKLAEFLTEEQLTAYDKFQEEQGFGPWGGRPRPPR